MRTFGGEVQRPVERGVAAADDDQIFARQNSHERLQFQKAVAALSTREREVLGELLKGHYNKNIADHLGIKERTVEFHRANIFEKLQVQSAVELAHKIGLLGRPPAA